MASRTPGRPPTIYDYQDRKLTLRQLSEETGLTEQTLYSRIHHRNMSVEEAIAKPVQVSSKKLTVSELLDQVRPNLERVEQKLDLLLERLEMMGVRLGP